MLYTLHTITLFIIDTLFPPSREHLLVRHTESLVGNMMIQKIERNGLHPVIALTAFRDAAVRATIHEAKFKANQKAWKLLGDVLVSYIQRCREAGDTRDVVLIPVPLARSRQRTRGYNQVTMVLHHAAGALPYVSVQNHWMYRRKKTQPQTELGKVARRKNVRGAFAVRKQSDTKVALNTRYIVLDDVCTTGATMHEALHTLISSGVPADAVSYAH